MGNIEIGKRYVTQSGKITGPVEADEIGRRALVDGSYRVYDKAGGHVFAIAGMDLVGLAGTASL